MLELNQIYCGDCLDIMKQIDDESIDLVFTSPPYNLGNRYANQTGKAIQGKWNRVIQYESYGDNMPEIEYRQWQRDVILEMWRIIKSTGAIYYNHKPRIQNGALWHRLDLVPPEVNLRQIIVWQRPKGHNFNQGYYVPSYEWIFLLAKPQYKLKKGYSGAGDVWAYPPARSDHPAPFPIDLPRRAIESSKNCSLVLDPFAGSGTTCLAAVENGCSYIGIEISPEYHALAVERVARHKST